LLDNVGKRIRNSFAVLTYSYNTFTDTLTDMLQFIRRLPPLMKSNQPFRQSARVFAICTVYICSP